MLRKRFTIEGSGSYKRTSDSSSGFTPNWLNISFVVPMHLIGLLAWPTYLYLSHGDIRWPEIAAFVFMFILGSIGVDVGYHRAFTHRAFHMSPFMRLLGLFGAASVGEGSALTWCSDHRRHHRFQDTDQDPYNVRRGFWWAHMGWILGSPTSSDFTNCPDLLKDKLVINQHKYYPIWLVLSCFLLPLGIGFLLGRPLQVFLFAGFTRLFLINHFTYLINSYAHYFGRRPYSSGITARDSLVCAILAQGEGWHNYHHRFPYDYRNGHRFYHYDPTKWFIFVAQFLGLTSNLKRTPAHEIYRARIQTKRQWISAPKTPHFAKLEEALDVSLAQWQEWHNELARIRFQMGEKGSKRIQTLKANANRARHEFKILYAEWKQWLKGMAAPV